MLIEDGTLVPKHVADRTRAANVWAIPQGSTSGNVSVPMVQEDEWDPGPVLKGA